MQLIGYADRLSVSPGDTLEFKVSAETPDYEAAFVRLIQVDDTPAAPDYREDVVPTNIAGRYEGRRQTIQPGSYMRADAPAAASPGGLTIQCWLLPTAPLRGKQGVITRWSPTESAGWALAITDDGHLAFWLRSAGGAFEQLQSSLTLRSGHWHFVACTYESQSGVARMRVDLVAPDWSIGTRRDSLEAELAPNLLDSFAASPILVAAFHDVISATDEAASGHLDGRIEGPKIYNRALPAEDLDAMAARSLDLDPSSRDLLACWDFSQDIGSAKIRDLSPSGLQGTLFNSPMRAVRGANWDGSTTVVHLAPEQYGAIHFHHDDLEDAGWETDFSLTVPETWRSGVYAAKLQSGDAEEYIPFFVRPPRLAATASAVFIVPTITYVAYANERFYRFPPSDWSRTSDTLLSLQDHDRYIEDHPEVGLSTYDLHADGSGTACYSSRLRPIINMRPKQVQYWNRSGRHFGADMYLISWLEHFSHPYDIVTDEDLHHEGSELLSRYKVAILGHHHEYWTWNMRHALEEYLGAGGRVMNLGGNQLWWVTGVHKEKPHLIEVRKEDFTYVEPLWGTHPAERYLSTTGEQGGTWRLRGLDPAQLVATSFAGEGWDFAVGFQRTAESFESQETSFIFEGLDHDEVIGGFGLAMGGAAGDEYDRVYFSFGAPPNTRTLASSRGHSDRDTKSGFAYQPVEEEVERVRTDIAYYEMNNGGAVFSAASMCWNPALPWNNYDNNVSRVTNNVLREFVVRPSLLDRRGGDHSCS